MAYDPAAAYKQYADSLRAAGQQNLAGAGIRNPSTDEWFSIPSVGDINETFAQAANISRSIFSGLAPWGVVSGPPIGVEDVREVDYQRGYNPATAQSALAQFMPVVLVAGAAFVAFAAVKK